MKCVKLLCIAVVLTILTTLCGCELFPANTDEMLSPPALTGIYAPIEQALKAVVSNYTLRYPSVGNNRSAFALRDIDGDGNTEAFAFYSTADDEMHVNAIGLDEEQKWISTDDQTVTAGDVEQVSFFDLDHDGVCELLVGWEVLPATDKQLSVYRVEKGKLVQQALLPYTEYLCCNLESDDTAELLVQTLNTTESTNSATVYRMADQKVKPVSKCDMDHEVKTVSSIINAKLSNGKTAVYVDEQKNAGAVTEVLFMDQGKLVNPLLDYASGINTQTARSASLLCQDFDGDGMLDIPVAQEMQSADPQDAEKVYYTKWCSYSGVALVPTQITLMNQTDGYYLSIPETWIDRVVIKRDSDLRCRLFSACDEKYRATEMLFELYAVPIKEWDADDRPEGLEEYCRTAECVIAGKIFQSKNPLATTAESLRKMIFAIE